MKKMALLMVLLLLVQPVTANAATTRGLISNTKISFSNTTANCRVVVTGNSMNDKIEMVVKLWEENTCIATWETSGIGHVDFSRSKSVTKGKNYTLTADVTLNGKSYKIPSYTDRCD